MIERRQTLAVPSDYRHATLFCLSIVYKYNIEHYMQYFVFIQRRM